MSGVINIDLGNLGNHNDISNIHIPYIYLFFVRKG